MGKRAISSLSIAAYLALLSATLVLAQDSGVPAQPMPPTPAQASVTSPATLTETQWLYGEVVSVDAAANTVTIKYLDYETDQEKEAVIAIDDKTSFENVASLGEIKPKDALSIDYVVGQDGKYIAKNISAEKSQEGESAQAPNAAVPVVETSAAAPAAEAPATSTTQEGGS